MAINKTFQITYEDFAKITKYFSRVEAVEEMEKVWTSGIMYILNKGVVRIDKEKEEGKLNLQLKNCPQKIKKDIVNILGGK